MIRFTKIEFIKILALLYWLALCENLNIALQFHVRHGIGDIPGESGEPFAMHNNPGRDHAPPAEPAPFQRFPETERADRPQEGEMGL